MRFDEIGEGDEAPVRTHRLTRTDLVRYAGASGDFNPMHHDDEQARAAGLPSVFGHGMLSMGLLATALTDWAGSGNVVSYRVRFTRQTWPGEVLRSRIVVTGKRRRGDEGRQLVDLSCELANEAGEVKVAGEATVVVP